MEETINQLIHNAVWLYPAGFVVMWLAVCAMIAVIGGWHTLSRNHPLPPGLLLHEKKHYFQTMQIGYFTRYKSSMTVTVLREGIVLQPIILFAFMHKPIFVRYHEIKNMKFGRFLYVTYLTFYLDGKRIRLYGRAVKAIRSKIGDNPY